MVQFIILFLMRRSVYVIDQIINELHDDMQKTPPLRTIISPRATTYPAYHMIMCLKLGQNILNLALYNTIDAWVYILCLTLTK